MTGALYQRVESRGCLLEYSVFVPWQQFIQISGFNEKKPQKAALYFEKKVVYAFSLALVTSNATSANTSRCKRTDAVCFPKVLTDPPGNLIAFRSID